MEADYIDVGPVTDPDLQNDLIESSGGTRFDPGNSRHPPKERLACRKSAPLQPRSRAEGKGSLRRFQKTIRGHGASQIALEKSANMSIIVIL